MYVYVRSADPVFAVLQPCGKGVVRSNFRCSALPFLFPHVLKAGLPHFRVFPRICRLKKAALKENRKIRAVLSAREGKTVFFLQSCLFWKTIEDTDAAKKLKWSDLSN